MSSWLPLLLEACLATLMAALIVYCVKLNRRLSLLRSQDAQISELIAGFREASDRAELSGQRLKAAGLAAERSLRGAIADAAAARAELARVSAGQTAGFMNGPSVVKPAPGTAHAAPDRSAETSSAPDQGARAKRDMLMDGVSKANANVAVAPSQAAPRTRAEAEESVIQAIRSARGEA